MNVLIVHPQMALFGGAEKVVVYLAKAMMRKGWNVKIATLSTQNHQQYEGLDIVTPENQVNYKIRGGRFTDGFEIVKIWGSLASLAKQYVAWADFFNPHNFPASWAVPPNFKHKTLWICNEIPGLWHAYKPSFWLKTAVKFGEKFDRHVVNWKIGEAVVSDEWNAKLFVERYGWTPKIVPYGVEEDWVNISHKELEKFWEMNKGWVEGYPLILQVGMVSPSKDQLTTLMALKALKRKYPKVKCFFAGYFDEKDGYYVLLRNYISSAGLKENVCFLGHVSPNFLKVFYRMVDLAVFPGKGQGSWLSPLEALVSGLPVTVSERLPCSKLVSKWMLTFNGAEDLALNIERIVGLHDWWRGKAKLAQQYILENLTWENYCEKVLKVISSLF